MDQVAEIFRECSLLRSLVFDEYHLPCDLDILVQIPLVRVLACLGNKRHASTLNVWPGLLFSDSPKQERFCRSPCEYSCSFPFAPAERLICVGDVGPDALSELLVRDER